jgi:hypothetical protein
VPFRLPRLFFVVIFGAGGIASLVTGLVVGHGRLLSLVLIIWGTALLVVAAVAFVATRLAGRREIRQLSPSQQWDLLGYLRVSRFVRAAIWGALGTALVIAGIALLIVGAGLGALVLGIGSFSCLIAGLNIWIARHVARELAPEPTDGPSGGSPRIVPASPASDG